MTDPGSLEPEVPDPGRRAVGEGLISGTAWTAIHVIVSVPIAFLVNVLVARSLGVVGYGRLAILTMVLAVATAAASSGVGAALMQFVTTAAESGRRREVSRLVSGAQGYNLLLAAPVVAIVVAVVVDVPWPFLVLAVVFGIFGPALLQVGPVLLASAHRSDRAAQLAMVSNAFIQLAVVVTVLIHPSAGSVWAARVAATGTLMVLPFLALSRSLRRAALRPAPPWSLPRPFWVFAVPTGVATLLSQLATDRVQVFFLEWLGDSVSVGLFALAFGLAIHILAPVQAAVGPLLPAFAALRERGADRARDGLLRVTHVAAVVTGSVLSLGVPILAGLIPWIYGDEYVASSDYFVLMACAAGVVVVGSGSFASLMARLRGASYLYINAAALAVMAGMALATIPGWGAWGAVASMVGGTSSRALMMVAVETSHHGIRAWRMTASFTPMIVAIIVTVTVWFVLGSRAPGPEWASAVAGGVISFALFAVALRLTRTGLAPTDREALLGVVPSRVRPVASLSVQLVSSTQAGGPLNE